MTRNPATPALVAPVMVVGLLAISSAAPLVRMVGDLHPVAIAFWRTLGAALLLLPFIRRPSARAALLVLLAGACLAAHFWIWFASLRHTSVMRSTVLVTLAPVWVGLLEWGVLRAPPPRRFWLGLALAIPGVALMSGSGGAGSLFGDALALAGGMFSACYFVVGRSVRQRVEIGSYGALFSLATAAWLLPAAGVADADLWGFDATTWLVLAALTLGPQLMGHVGFNYAMRYVSASHVSALILLEPVGATLLAVVLFAEVPGVLGALGGLVTVAGVLVATQRRRSGQT